MNRRELLELLLEQTKRNEQLAKENAALRLKLDERKILLAESGSIAEASLKLSGIFEAAQDAADRYLESVKAMHPAAEEASHE